MIKTWQSSTCIRFFDASDIDGLLGVINALCAEGCMQTTYFESTPDWEHVLSGALDNTYLLFVAADGSTPIGWCRLFPTENSGEGELGIGLLKPYRNQGLGTQLTQQAINWAAAHGFTFLTLTTREDNTRAIHVFEKCGFVCTGKREDAWLEMVRAIGESGNDD